MKKILFVSHEATRTGAPIVLLHFMQWLKNTRELWNIHQVSLKGGELLPHFEKIADKSFQNFDLAENYKKHFKYIFPRINDKIFNQQSFQRKFTEDHYSEIASGNYDIIYANTIMAIPFATEIKKRSTSNSKIIAHIHELESIIEEGLPGLNNYVPKIDRFIAASNPVKDNLLLNHKIKKDRVRVIYEFSRIDAVPVTKSEKKNFIVGGSGTAHWRKGDDIFIHIARYLKTHFPDANIRFQWVGEVPAHQKFIIRNDLIKAGLENYVEFIGSTSEPHSYYSNFDVFLMISREDPFPLVCIETAMLKIPIICFDKGNGIAEILNSGGGTVIPYLNIEAAASQIMFYYNNPDVKIQHGNEGAVLFGKFTPENQCPQILELITEVTSNN